MDDGYPVLTGIYINKDLEYIVTRWRTDEEMKEDLIIRRPLLPFENYSGVSIPRLLADIQNVNNIAKRRKP